MKRQPAVLGPTPQFVRWAVDFECELREEGTGRSPAATFRQLRSLASISEGVLDRRCYRGFCFSSSTVEQLAKAPAKHLKADDVANIKAIPIREVVEWFGGIEQINRACGNCPVNGNPTENDATARWAGCFGYLSTDPGWSVDRAHSDFQLNEVLVGIVDQFLSNNLDDFCRAFPAQPPHAGWYGLWLSTELRGLQLKLLEGVLDELIQHVESNSGLEESAKRELTRFRNVASLAREHDCSIAVELVPQGFSDGRHWRIAAHCPDCRAQRNVSPCPKCHSSKGIVGEQKRQVLGDRPYLRLEDIVGREQTLCLATEYIEQIEQNVLSESADGDE